MITHRKYAFTAEDDRGVRVKVYECSRDLTRKYIHNPGLKIECEPIRIATWWETDAGQVVCAVMSFDSHPLQFHIDPGNGRPVVQLTKVEA